MLATWGKNNEDEEKPLSPVALGRAPLCSLLPPCGSYALLKSRVGSNRRSFAYHRGVSLRAQNAESLYFA